tara:strand:+ start:4939 stop:5592 length:654 start_codon:yes stop_codon:yes gene_type:complete
MTYVYLKFGQYSETDSSDLTINTIPLNVTSVGVSVSKTIPAFPIPFSGIVTGESVTAALDLGMATKQIDLSGFISETTLRKTRTAFEGEAEEETARVFTAHEIAQMIASGVDSTGLQNNQSMNELVILYPSNVDEKYRDRDNGGTGSRGHLIPFNFASRGTEGFGDNDGVSFRGSKFPETSTSTGMTGFIRSFSFNMEAEAVDLSFSMQFEVAVIGP